ncbi:RDD family protein [Kineosporia babensis]|uniref:RDD family protein n=1 Tax=Kineosporia babensis TaxID=499548 RepID=UPI0022B04F51|nr:RDD family protein [Kineosporia babensis]
MHAAIVALVVALVYEPATSLTGGTVGKRLMRVEAISVWESRPLSMQELVVRAALIDLQIVLFPLAIRTAAWVLWAPARQGLADRLARSVVIQGRSPNAHKV